MGGARRRRARGARRAVGGFVLVEADSIDDAVALARQLPAPLAGGGIEVRPVYVDEGDES